MPRPRTPSKILELRGSFKRNPSRRRTDADGSGEFDTDPPQHLPQAYVPAWRWVVDRLPLVAMTRTDEIAVEVAARTLGHYWITGDVKLLRELRAWLCELGFTPLARTKIPAPAAAPKNEFDELDDQ